MEGSRIQDLGLRSALHLFLAFRRFVVYKGVSEGAIWSCKDLRQHILQNSDRASRRPL